MLRSLTSNFLKKYKSMHIEAKASIWYTLCNILQKGIAFIVVPIYVRLLSTAEYGRYTTFQTWKEIIIIFATLNLYCGVFTKAMVDLKTDKERDRYTSSMQFLTTIICAFLFVIYISLHNLWNRLLDTNTLNILLMFMYFITFPAFNFWSVRKKVENKYISMVIITLLISVVTPAFSLFLLFYSDLREDALIRGFLITQIAVGAVMYVYQYIIGKFAVDIHYWKRAVKYNIPLIPHYLSLIVLGQADRLMIKEMCGDAEAGIYSLAYSISTLMNVVIAAVNSSMVPWVYNKLRLKEYRKIKEISKSITTIMGVATLLLTICAPEIIKIMGPKDYYSAVWIIPAVSLGIFYTFCYNLYCNIEFYYSRTKYVMIASSCGAIINVILNYIFIPIFGFIAAGYTTLICYFIFMLVHFFFMKKVCNEEKIKDAIFDNNFIMLFTLILSIICLAMQIVYSSIVIRGLILILMGIVLYVKRGIIAEFMNIRKEK